MVWRRVDPEMNNHAGCADLDRCCYKVRKYRAQKRLREEEHHGVLSLNGRRQHPGRMPDRERVRQSFLSAV